MALKNSSYDIIPVDEPPKPKLKNDVGAVATFLAAIGVLVLGLVFVPGLRHPLIVMLQSPSHPRLEPNAFVWVKKDGASYYCADSVLYGFGSGSFMKQGDALTEGYQPALGDYCQTKQPAKITKGKASSRPSDESAKAPVPPMAAGQL